MKKIKLIVTVITLLVVSAACSTVNGDVTTTESSTTVPGTTGYPSGTVQMPMIYLNGKLYVFDYYCHISNMDAEDYIKEHGLVQIGETKSEQNEEPPAEEYVAARLPVATKIYSDKDGKLYALDNGRILALKLKEN